ncbi:hypothetical protein [Halorubrum sp. BOL3-1]|uniref:hypothetical protein n=1 Tax=Halorubrum sp. BOL3-1 TaxID=2497325 RepID=UPI00140E7611|nr:hypothetical protein [Halorubrum sp. BOL3-1]
MSLLDDRTERVQDDSRFHGGEILLASHNPLGDRPVNVLARVFERDREPVVTDDGDLVTRIQEMAEFDALDVDRYASACESLPNGSPS